MENLFYVVLADGTIGTMDSDCLDGQHPSEFIGEFVSINSKDENGFKCVFEGVLAKVGSK